MDNSKQENITQTCLDIKPLLDAYIDNELNENQWNTITHHLSECESCKSYLSSLYQIRDMIKFVYMPKCEIDISKKIMSNINCDKKYIPAKEIKLPNKTKKTIKKKMVYSAMVVASLICVICASFIFFSPTDKVSVDVATQTYDKIEDYVIEHYSNSYTPPARQVSVRTVNFEK